MEPLTEPQRRVLEMALTEVQQGVLELVKGHPHVSPTELRDEMGLRRRIIADALKELKRRNLVKEIPDLMDMRKITYVAT